MSATFRRLATAALAAFALAPAPLWAAPASPAADKDAAPTAAEKVRKALDAPVTLKIDKQPLTAAVDTLKEKGKVNLVLDTLSIQQLGWQPEQPPVPVDVDLKGVPLKAALRTVLEPYGLSYAVVGDTVLVTTEAVATQRRWQQRVSLALDKVELGEALRQLRRETGANVALDGRLGKEKTPVSLELEDVPLETAVRLLAETAGLKPVRVGDALFVTAKATADELRRDPDLVAGAAPAAGQQVEEVVQAVGPNGQIITRRVIVAPAARRSRSPPTRPLPPRPPRRPRASPRTRRRPATSRRPTRRRKKTPKKRRRTETSRTRRRRPALRPPWPRPVRPVS
jgi:hypothetical protein